MATIGAVGAGRMGQGIAIAFAIAGHDIVLIDAKDRPVADLQILAHNARRAIGGDLDFLVSCEAMTRDQAAQAMARIAIVGRADAAAALGGCDVLFEGVPETVAAKADCFAFVSAHVPDGCIIASTTSTIDPDTLAVLVTRPERFLNAHWLNPAHLMPLVELSPAAATDPAVLSRMKALLVTIGKMPIVCKGAGYIVPRIQALAMNEAARMVEEGVATAQDIDAAIRVGIGLRFGVLGMLEFSDWGGGDILYHASAFLAGKIDAHRFEAAAIVRQNMEKGRTGLRDGAGFYDYDGVDVDAYRTGRLTEFVTALRQKKLMPKFAGQAGDGQADADAVLP
jgi:3-hydroxybutyryl-CoA dehydrogenase